MKKSSTWLLEHQNDKYSQAGEDGIIKKILEVIPQKDKWCVEFGAWDGVFASTTRNLIISQGYSAVLIEPDIKKFVKLKENYAQEKSIITLNKFVGFAKEDNLDNLLAPTGIPENFDFLSIDIDGNDYYVWKAFLKYKPKVIVIEFNPTIPTHIRFVQSADQSVNQGASLMSLVELGKEKGYELVSVLRFNAFFVKKEYFPLFEIEFNDPYTLRTNLDDITYLFSGYDGRIFLNGRCKLPWHDIEIQEAKIQQLPMFLRRYPGSFTVFHKLFFELYVCIIQPHVAIKRIRDRIKTWVS